jgi:hypothetical protein
VCLFSYAATHLVVDLNGAYSPSAGTAKLAAVPPTRLLDTRLDGVMPAAGSITTIAVAGTTGVGADATAVALNVTATDAPTAGFITVYACGTPVPATSNLNFAAGQTIAVSVTAPVGTDGTVCLFSYAATHLVVDLNGAYSPRD